MDRTSLVQSAAVAAISIAALALLGAVGAYWTWQWFGPKPEARLSPYADAETRIASATGLFGTPPSSAESPTAAASDALRLAGVVAATPGRDAYAIVVLNNQEILAARQGEEVAPGILLVEVATHHVVLERNGMRETLALPEKAPAAETAGPRTNR